METLKEIGNLVNGTLCPFYGVVDRANRPRSRQSVTTASWRREAWHEEWLSPASDQSNQTGVYSQLPADGRLAKVKSPAEGPPIKRSWTAWNAQLEAVAVRGKHCMSSHEAVATLVMKVPTHYTAYSPTSNSPSTTEWKPRRGLHLCLICGSQIGPTPAEIACQKPFHAQASDPGFTPYLYS